MGVQIINWPENQSREEWLQARRKIQGVGETYTRVSASDIGTITSSSKWRSKRRLFLSLADLYHKNTITPITAQGNLAEDMVGKYAEAFSIESFDQTLENVTNGVRVQRLEQAKFFALNDKHPHLSASLDFVPEKGCQVYSPWTGELYHPLTPFETKYVNPQAYAQWSGEITQAYKEQLMIQMGVTETKVAVFNVLRWDGQFTQTEVEFDNDLFMYLNEEAGKFCRDVTRAKILSLQIEQTDDELQKADLYAEIENIVPFDDLSDTVDIEYERKFENVKEFKDCENDSEEDKLLRDFVTLTNEKNLSESKLNNLKAQLINLTGEFSGIQTPNYKATIRGGNSGRSKYFKITEINKDKFF